MWNVAALVRTVFALSWAEEHPRSFLSRLGVLTSSRPS
jgi:hypothetical protein